VNVCIVLPVLAVLIVAGLHVPLIPFVDIVDRTGAVEFRQSDPIAVKVGKV